MLEVDNNKKTGQSLRMLSINFMHPPSLLTWFEMRRMGNDIGKRFKIRIEGDVTCFISVILLLMGFLLLRGLGYIKPSPILSPAHLLALLILVTYLGFNGFKALFAAAMINESTKSQITRLIKLRGLTQRMLRDGKVNRIAEKLLSGRGVSREVRMALIWLDYKAKKKMGDLATQESLEEEKIRLLEESLANIDEIITTME